MKRILVGAALAACAGGAYAQDEALDTKWGFYQPDGEPMQAGVVAADGSQLILKCDKRGKREVYAVVVATGNLARTLPDSRFETYPVTLRMDSNPPWEDNWRFNDRFAMAVDKGNTRSLTRLLEKLHSADALEVRLRPLQRSPTVIRFETTGARDAIQRVYESCGDEVPFS